MQNEGMLLQGKKNLKPVQTVQITPDAKLFLIFIVKTGSNIGTIRNLLSSYEKIGMTSF
jgi:hypothetical protein